MCMGSKINSELGFCKINLAFHLLFQDHCKMKYVFVVIDHYITTIFIKLVEDLSPFSPLLFLEQSLHVI